MMCPVLREDCLKHDCEWFLGDSCAVVRIAVSAYASADVLNSDAFPTKLAERIAEQLKK
jgi:hypothetical protein